MQPGPDSRSTIYPNFEPSTSRLDQNLLEAQEMDDDHLGASDSENSADGEIEDSAMQEQQDTHKVDEANWELVMTKRQKNRQRKNGWNAASAGNSPAPPPTAAAPASGALKNDGKGAQRQPRQRLPPLPRDDFKIILRPKGLVVKSLQQFQVARAVAAACSNKFEGRDLITRLRTGSNIIIVSTPNEEAAQLARRITSLTIEGRSYDVNAYVAAPENTRRGVIHGVDPRATPEELKTDLWTRTQGVTIHSARRLGKTKTAVITFDGPITPKHVIYCGAEYKCYPYRPTRQICYVCCQQGHRSDVCPTPDAKACKQCGMQNPPKDHQCTPRCLICGGNHATGSRECQDRLKKARDVRGKANGGNNGGGRESRRRSRDDRGKKPRWFSSEGETSRSRSRSRASRSRSRSRSRSFPPLPPLAIKGGSQLQQQQQRKKTKKEPTRKSGGVKTAGHPSCTTLALAG
ncbi:uncharacterized protein [Dermacentor andersoni]|uniref:uncharacterized protein n=1 Tax=Dermacentor andersoni TaxID=34620 RepID=UPI003B3BD28B